MIKNVSFDTKEYKHGISLWVVIEHEGVKTRKLLGSTFEDKNAVNAYLSDIFIKGITNLNNCLHS